MKFSVLSCAGFLAAVTLFSIVRRFREGFHIFFVVFDVFAVPCGLGHNLIGPFFLCGRRRFCCVDGRITALKLFPLCQAHDNFTSLRSIVGSDNSVFGHEVDQPCGTPVADPQATLEQRNTSAALANHDIHRTLVQVISFLQFAATAGSRFFHLELHEFFDEVLFAGAHEFNNGINLIV